MTSMLSPEEIRRYREMGPELGRRRWERIRQEHDEGNRRLLEGLARQGGAS